MVSAPPCDRCDGACCRRGAYGSQHACRVGEHEDVPYRHLLVDGWLPFDEHTGACIMLDGDGKCQLHDTPHKPEHCRRSSCVGDSYFLSRNPRVARLVTLTMSGRAL